MKKIITIVLIAISITTFTPKQMQAQLLSWQQKMELAGAPSEMSRTVLKELFKANGFVYADYSSAGAMVLENSLSKENNKWYVIGNRHHWGKYIELGRGNISINMDKNQLIFKNSIPSAKLKSAITKDNMTIAKATAVKEANASITYTNAEQSVINNLKYFQELVVLDGITGDFDKTKLKELLVKNDLPRSSYGGFGGIDLMIFSLQSIGSKWYVVIHKSQTKLFDKYSDKIRIKLGKMTFANKL